MRHLLLVLAFAGFAGTAMAEDTIGTYEHVPRLTMHASFGSTGVHALKLQGVDLMASPDVALKADGGGLTMGQWIGIGFTGVVLAVIAVEAADEEEDLMGTGSGNF